jgi:hypothetical protein
MQRDPNARVPPTSDLRLWSWRRDSNRNLLFRRCERPVWRGLPSTVLAGQVSGRVWSVSCCSLWLRPVE